MVMSASSFSGFPADARILGLDIGSISVDVVLLDGLGTPLYSRYVRHHGQPDKVLCAELEALERTSCVPTGRSRRLWWARLC